MDDLIIDITLEDGKYRVVLPRNYLDGGMKALRYGQPWRNLAGDNLILAMAQEIDRLRKQISDHKQP